MNTYKKYIEIHKKLNSMYTREEYLQLSGMIPRGETIKKRLKDYLKNGKLFTRINSSI
jgi:hypothetical protein